MTDRSLSVTPIRAGDEPLGWLAIATRGLGTAAVRQVATHGATVLALELVRRRADREAERRRRADLVEELLSSRLRREEADDLADRAARLGHPIPDPAWVIAFELDDPGDGHVVASAHAPHHMADEIRALAAARGSNAFVVERGGGLVVLASGLPELEAAEELAAAARDRVQGLVGAAAVSCGIGSRPCAPADLRRGAEEARQALRVARRLGERGTMASYRRLGIERLLLGIDPPELLEEYVEDWLGPLIRPGQGRGAPLVESLEALAHEGWNMRASARLLGVHVNTLLYRVGRIEQILGRTLDDPEVRMAMAVALRARRLVAGLEGVIDGARAERRGPAATDAAAPDARPTLRKLRGRPPRAYAPTAARSARGRTGARAPASACATATIATRVGDPSRASAGTTRARGLRASGLRPESTRTAAGTPAWRAAETAACATRDSRPIATASTAPPGPRASSQARAAGSSEVTAATGRPARARRSSMSVTTVRACPSPAITSGVRGASAATMAVSPGAFRRSAASSRARRSAASAWSSPSADTGTPIWRSPARGGRPGRWARRTMRCISG